jgi:type I restriction enzyme S subunit
MDRATFFKHFDLLADQADALAKMRGLVLELAVRGQLVEHNSKDELASKLLEKIKTEKREFLRANKFKEAEALPQIHANEAPFMCPSSWEWVRLGSISNRIHYGYTASADHSQRDVRLLRITDIQNNHVNWETVPGCQISAQEVAKYALHDNDILIARTGGTIGKTFLVANVAVKAVFASYLIRVIPSSQISAPYLKLFLESRCYWQQLLAKSAGTGQPNVNGEALSGLCISLPPLAEQRRIVAKVDELMTLCDELAVRQQAQHDAATQFQRSALHHLVAARDQATFATGLHRVSDHFHWLHDSPDSIAQLRQTILQLAVQGRLGTQDRKDEPAKKLIEQARAQWPERKVSERQNWKPEDPPCELPAGWEWTCLDVLGNTNPRNDADEKMEVAFTPMKFISAEFGRPAAFEIRPWGEVKKGFTHFANNDVVLAKITPCFENGKSAVMRGLKNGIGAGTTELHVFRRYDDCVLPDYVLLFFKTSHFIETGVPRMTGSAGQKRVSWEYFANSPFPLPPMAEQKRIVARVQELMQQCDVLESQLTDSRALGTQLLDSTIHHLFTVNQEQPDLVSGSGRSKK